MDLRFRVSTSLAGQTKASHVNLGLASQTM